MKLSEFLSFLPLAAKLRWLKVECIKEPAIDPLPVIVSLTSIPSRLAMLHYGIRSLLIQSRKPEKVILWLNDSLKKEIPKSLSYLVGDVFEIRYSPYTCSHRKLVHSLEAFPNKNIVTCDDDHIYPPEWLERLYSDHLKHPYDVIANTCRRIAYDEEGNTRPYKSWSTKVPSGEASMAIMPVGYGGVFYPPKVFNEDVTNADLYLKLAPYADDLWFKAMSYLNGTLCRKASQPSTFLNPVPGTRGVRLAKKNVNQDLNRKQWDDLRAHYQFKTP